MHLSFTGDPLPLRRIGLDAEALPAVSWYSAPIYKHAVCWGWGTADDVQYVEGIDRRPGRFMVDDLARLREDITQPDVVVVGHNAFKYDLPLLNGVMVAHGFDPLPDLRTQDTMGDLKTGYAYRNTLSAQCKRYGVNLKMGGPDWDLILMGDPAEWERMRAYNVNDVVSTLQLERALSAAGLPVAIRTWRAHK